MNGKQPKISILIPSLNVEKYVTQCIDSIINQTLSDIEIICIDAGSTDGTLDILTEYEKKDSRVKLVKSSKKLWISNEFRINFSYWRICWDCRNR